MFGRAPGPGRRGRAVRLAVKLAVLCVIFAAGAVAGALWGINYTFSQLHYQAEHMSELPDTVVPRLSDRLSLNPEQRTVFDQIFRKYHAQIAASEGENAVKVHQYFYEMGKEILAILDEKQAAEFREFHRKICTVFLPPIPQGFKVNGEPVRHPCEDL